MKESFKFPLLLSNVSFYVLIGKLSLLVSLQESLLDLRHPKNQTFNESVRMPFLIIIAFIILEISHCELPAPTYDVNKILNSLTPCPCHCHTHNS